MRYAIGHPAYGFPNHYTEVMNQEEAVKELMLRNVLRRTARRMVKEAASGSHATGLTKGKHSVIECVRIIRNS